MADDSPLDRCQLRTIREHLGCQVVAEAADGGRRGYQARILVVSALYHRESLLEPRREGAEDFEVKPRNAAWIEIALGRLTAANGV